MKNNVFSLLSRKKNTSQVKFSDNINEMKPNSYTPKEEVNM